jgi:hypothetical protein
MSSRFPPRLNVDHFATVNRRTFLRGLGASVLLTTSGSFFACSVWSSPVFAAYPFALGVASGARLPLSVCDRRRAKCGGAGTHAAAQGRAGSPVALRGCRLPTLRGRLLHGLAPPRGRALRFRTPLRRLHLRASRDAPRRARISRDSRDVTLLGDGFDINDRFRALMQQDPHIRFFNGQRGYVRHVVTPERWQADFQVLDKVSVPDGRLSTRASWVVENGKPGLAEA